MRQQGLATSRQRGSVSLTEKHQLVEAVVGLHREVYMVLNVLQQELAQLLPELWTEEPASGDERQSRFHEIRQALESSWGAVLRRLASIGQQVRELT